MGRWEGTPLDIKWNVKDGTLVIKVSGEMDLHTAGDFKQVVERASAMHRVRGLMVDLSDISFIDSSGMGALLGRFRQIRMMGGAMTIAAPSPQARQVLELAGISKIITIVDEPAIVEELGGGDQ